MGVVVRVEPIRAWNGRIQGWAVNHNNRELAFYRDRLRALNYAHRWVKNYGHHR